MDRESKKLKKHFEKHLAYDEMKAKKRAGKIRQTFRKDKGVVREQRVTEDNWEALLDQHGHSSNVLPSATSSSNSCATTRKRACADDGDLEGTGVVFSVSSGRCRVLRDGEELDCVIPPELAVRQKSALAVGDRVRVAEESGVWRLQRVLPRRTVLARPDPLHKHMQRLIAANVDVVIHVVSLKSPPLRPRLIDRFLIAIQRGGAQPVICVNKVDLLTAEERERELPKLAPYLDLGVPVIGCSTKTGEGLEALRARGRREDGRARRSQRRRQVVDPQCHRRAAAAGHEHAQPQARHRPPHHHRLDALRLRRRHVSHRHPRHPRVRPVGPRPRIAARLLPRVRRAERICRFTNCTHVHEPNCEVKALVEAGELNSARYETYVRLWEDLA